MLLHLWRVLCPGGKKRRRTTQITRYLPKGGEMTVDLSAANGMFAVEWCHPVTGAVTFGEPVEGKARRSFTSPLPHEGVLYLHPLKP